jgi:hypothetical protein
MKIPFESDREFSIVVYLISHGLLLLRSGHSEARPTRVDILFQDVRWIGIPTSMSGVRIEEGQLTDIPVALTPAVERDADGLSVFRLISEGVTHCLLASSSISSTEHEKNFFMDSSLLPNHDLSNLFDPKA